MFSAIMGEVGVSNTVMHDDLGVGLNVLGLRLTKAESKADAVPVGEDFEESELVEREVRIRPNVCFPKNHFLRLGG